MELLWKGPETFRKIFEAVRGARKFICLEFYIYRNDETGRELTEILKVKARKGVRVYLLYDHFGSLGTPGSFWKGLRKTGVKVAASHVFKLLSPAGYAHRDHRKLIIVDGKIAFTGGLNIANEYRGFHLRRKRGWRDTGVLIKGPAAAALTGSFIKDWVPWGKEEIETGIGTGPEEGHLPVMPIFAGSARGRRRLRRLLYYSINHARSSILLTTAYFCPSRRMIETLEAATIRGVKIKLLVPGVSDVPAAYYAGRAQYKRLLEAGVEIYHYSGEVLHAKSYIFDGEWSIVGSANLDFQSLRWNDEGNIGILDPCFAQELTDIFSHDLMRSEQVTLQGWRKRPFWGKVKEKFFLLFRRRL